MNREERTREIAEAMCELRFRMGKRPGKMRRLDELVLELAQLWLEDGGENGQLST